MIVLWFPVFEFNSKFRFYKLATTTEWVEYFALHSSVYLWMVLIRLNCLWIVVEIRDVCSAWRDCDLTNISLLENEHRCQGIFICTYLPGRTGWWWSSATATEKEWLLAACGPTKKLSMVRVLWPQQQQRLTLIRSMFFRPGRSFFIHGWHGVLSMLVFYTLVFLTFFFFIWANAFRISSSLAVLVGDFFACGWVWLGWSTEGRIGEDITRQWWWAMRVWTKRFLIYELTHSRTFWVCKFPEPSVIL